MHALDYALQFARFVQEYNLDPYAVRILVKAIRKAISAGERQCNEGTAEASAKHSKAMATVEKCFAELGLTPIVVDWPGLVPHAVHKGRPLRVPLP